MERRRGEGKNPWESFSIIVCLRKPSKAPAFITRNVLPWDDNHFSLVFLMRAFGFYEAGIPRVNRFSPSSEQKKITVLGG